MSFDANEFESLEAFTARMEANGQGSAWADFLAKHGPVPAYNGIIGDSCDCPACNLRRIDDFDPMNDVDKNLTPSQSKARVEAGYARLGIPTPYEATREGVQQRLTKEGDGMASESDDLTAIITQVLDALSVNAAIEQVRTLAPGAREQFKKSVSDPALQAKLDEMIALASDMDRLTPTTKARLNELSTELESAYNRATAH